MCFIISALNNSAEFSNPHNFEVVMSINGSLISLQQL